MRPPPKTLSVSTQMSALLTKRNSPKLKKVWNQAKLQAEAKQKVDAVARVHGEPVTMLTCDWVSLMNQLKQKYGQHIHESRLPSQTHSEAYEEKLADGLFYTETPAQMISLAEDNKQNPLKLDNTLTIQTKRRCLPFMPATCVKGMYPARHIHEHFTIHKWLRQTAYILTHNLNMLEHIANNGMNTTTHTNANIAQF